MTYMFTHNPKWHLILSVYTICKIRRRLILKQSFRFRQAYLLNGVDERFHQIKVCTAMPLQSCRRQGSNRVMNLYKIRWHRLTNEDLTSKNIENVFYESTIKGGNDISPTHNGVWSSEGHVWSWRMKWNKFWRKKHNSKKKKKEKKNESVSELAGRLYWVVDKMRNNTQLKCCFIQLHHNIYA